MREYSFIYIYICMYVFIFMGLSNLYQFYYFWKNALQTKKPILFQLEHFSKSIYLKKKWIFKIIWNGCLLCRGRHLLNNYLLKQNLPGCTYYIHLDKVMESFSLLFCLPDEKKKRKERKWLSSLPNEKRKWRNKKYMILRITSARDA